MMSGYITTVGVKGLYCRKADSKLNTALNAPNPPPILQLSGIRARETVAAPLGVTNLVIVIVAASVAVLLLVAGLFSWCRRRRDKSALGANAPVMHVPEGHATKIRNKTTQANDDVGFSGLIMAGVHNEASPSQPSSPSEQHRPSFNFTSFPSTYEAHAGSNEKRARDVP